MFKFVIEYVVNNAGLKELRPVRYQFVREENNYIFMKDQFGFTFKKRTDLVFDSRNDAHKAIKELLQKKVNE